MEEKFSLSSLNSPVRALPVLENPFLVNALSDHINTLFISFQEEIDS